jgi:hypothetical protein
VLWNSEDVFVARECNIKGYTFRASRLGVGISAKGFVPPSAFIFSRLFLCLGVFSIAFLLLLLWLVDLGTPVFNIHQSSVVQSDVGLSIPLEFNAEGRVGDDGLKLAPRTIDYLGGTRLSIFDSSSTRAEFGSANDSPLLGLVVALFPGFGAMTKLDMTEPDSKNEMVTGRRTGWSEVAMVLRIVPDNWPLEKVTEAESKA